MKLRQLQCLCAVVDAGFNISRAAAVLHATQPAIGKQVRELEEELGVDLLVRQGGRTIGLTDTGERVLGWARRAMQCADNIRAVAKETGNEAGGSIMLATSPAHANYVLLPAIVEFTRRFPRVRINVLQGGSGHVAELVRDGTVTFGVAHSPPVLPKDVVAIPFLTSPRQLIAPEGHALFEKETVTLADLVEYPIILPYSLRPQGGRILSKFQDAGLEANVAVQALDAEVVKTYVGAGLGVGIIPAFCFSAERDKGLRVRDVAHLFEPAVSVVLLRRESHLMRYVYAFLQQLDPSLDNQRIESHLFEEPI